MEVLKLYQSALTEKSWSLMNSIIPGFMQDMSSNACPLASYAILNNRRKILLEKSHPFDKLTWIVANFRSYCENIMRSSK
jgi:hypothetical protein